MLERCRDAYYTADYRAHIDYPLLFLSFRTVHSNKPATATSATFHILLPSTILENGWKSMASAAYATILPSCFC